MSDPSAHEQAMLKAFRGEPADNIANWEHWSCPDGASYLAGIDFYEHPKRCHEKINSMYPLLGLGVSKNDEAIPRPEDQENKGKGRWGANYRDHWQQEDASHRFETREDMLKFSPLEQADFTGWNVVVDGDFSSEEVIYERFRKNYPAEWGDRPPEGEAIALRIASTIAARNDSVIFRLPQERREDLRRWTLDHRPKQKLTPRKMAVYATF